MKKNKLEIMWQVVDRSQSVHWAAAKLGKSEKTIKRYAARLKAIRTLYHNDTQLLRLCLLAFSHFSKSHPVHLIETFE